MRDCKSVLTVLSPFHHHHKKRDDGDLTKYSMMDMMRRRSSSTGRSFAIASSKKDDDNDGHDGMPTIRKAAASTSSSSSAAGVAFPNRRMWKNEMQIGYFRSRTFAFGFVFWLVAFMVVASMLLLGQKLSSKPSGSVLVRGRDFSWKKNPEDEQLKAEIYSLIDRVVGRGPQGQVFRPHLEILPSSSTDETKKNNDTTTAALTSIYDTFHVDFDDAHPVILRGNSGVALASALNYYLGEYANCSVSWGRNGTGNNVRSFWNLSTSTATPPAVTRQTIKQKAVQWSYYMNVCTASYSMVWWDFERWRQEIDWMAMSGINLALAFTGTEAVLRDVFMDQYNISETGFQSFVSGPAFLAWDRMGNIRGWGGPLSMEFIDQQKRLQLQILDAMRALDITPVLPGFSGRVPHEFVEKYPQAKATRLPLWERFSDEYSGVYKLEATDPMFREVGAAITATTRKLYGSSKDKYRFYNMDTYNEMLPPSNDPVYLAESSNAVYKAMTSGDPDGIWLMQGWLFIRTWWGPEQMKGYLSDQAVPDDKMIILDLDAQWAPQYTKIRDVSNKTIIWCLLHSYGGRRDLYGNLTGVQENVRQAYEQLGPSAMVGTGITPEAIDMNYFVFNFMNELGWELSDGPVDTATWAKEYSRKRYGALHDTDAAATAWLQMLSTVYSSESRSNSWMIVRPSLFDYESVWAYDMQFGTTMSSSKKHAKSLAHSLGLLLDSAGEDELPSTLSYDIVDFARQILSLTFEAAGGAYNTAFQHGDVEAMSALGRAMLDIMLNLDRLLATNVNFLLGTWLEDARKLASNSVEEDLFSFNAKNQITLWGPDGQIADYASKPWAGLVRRFHYERWSKFINMTIEAATASPGTAFDPTTFNAFDLELGKRFCNDTATGYSVVPSDENVVELARKVQNDYAASDGVYYGFCESQDFVLSSEKYSVTLPGLPVGTLAFLCSTVPSCAAFKEGVLLVGGTVEGVPQHNASVFVACNLLNKEPNNTTGVRK